MFEECSRLINISGSKGEVDGSEPGQVISLPVLEMLLVFGYMVGENLSEGRSTEATGVRIGAAVPTIYHLLRWLSFDCNPYRCMVARDRYNHLKQVRSIRQLTQ